MTIELTPALEQRLQHLAEAQHCTPDEFANQALTNYLDFQLQLAEDIREGEESAEREGWIEHAEVERIINEHVANLA